jgi:hypothetical protein
VDYDWEEGLSEDASNAKRDTSAFGSVVVKR